MYRRFKRKEALWLALFTTSCYFYKPHYNVWYTNVQRSWQSLSPTQPTGKLQTCKCLVEKFKSSQLTSSDPSKKISQCLYFLNIAGRRWHNRSNFLFVFRIFFLLLYLFSFPPLFLPSLNFSSFMISSLIFLFSFYIFFSFFCLSFLVFFLPHSPPPSFVLLLLLHYFFLISLLALLYCDGSHNFAFKHGKD